MPTVATARVQVQDMLPEEKENYNAHSWMMLALLALATYIFLLINTFIRRVHSSYYLKDASNASPIICSILFKKNINSNNNHSIKTCNIKHSKVIAKKNWISEKD